MRPRPAAGRHLPQRAGTRSVQSTPEGRWFEPWARRRLPGVAEALHYPGDQAERRRGPCERPALLGEVGPG
ncbi:hypothetical protein [Xylophilus ampelinus]|uniref:hypothetical protein n=1 Tax=Xylophilus ampelinus TaxID=54067 RepID=UPI000D7C2CEC|nr:hypothetical protein [Xylophilus ampelinus]MCS4511375.1 hypothetical protein [Xylophilus ampelinus]